MCATFIYYPKRMSAKKKTYYSNRFTSYRFCYNKTSRTSIAAIHATAHCQNTTPTAHFPPSSRLIEATAATHGVYNKLNTSRDAAESGVRTDPILPPKSTSSVDTTLSFAINPLIRAVHIRQSPRPSGANTGTSSEDTAARILSAEFLTMFRRRSKLCKNHTTTVATKITENAFCKKSLAFSHKSCATFRTPGSR